MYNTLEFMLYLESYLHIGLHVKTIQMNYDYLIYSS